MYFPYLVTIYLFLIYFFCSSFGILQMVSQSIESSWPVEDLEILKSFYLKAKNLKQSSSENGNQIEPPSPSSFILETSSEFKAKCFNSGIEHISKGKLAIITLAGGQGTRLGSSLPKGCFDIGLLSHKSLFQLQAERILKLQSLIMESSSPSSNASLNSSQTTSPSSPLMIKWLIMTSPATETDTKSFFNKNRNFGLSPLQIFYFNQSTMPALDDDGKAIQDNNGNYYNSPNGNGGVFQALKSTGMLDMLLKDGIEWIHIYCVDNVLVKPGDPVFLGAALSRPECDCLSKSIPKNHPTESVGVFCMTKQDGGNGEMKLGIREYSELAGEMAQKRKEGSNNELLFGDANMVNHLFKMDLILKVSKESLPLHIARKKIYGDVMGNKLETFIFDAIPFSSCPLIFRVERESEYSPLKNSTGYALNNAETCRIALYSLYRKWLERANAKLLIGTSEECEISPLTSYNGEGLEKFDAKEIKLPFEC